ncbi:metallophosphoesterase [Halonatronum saccharophilum]|uniref:metallophosphoesterase n=1 Tax=Halonatronum saccharophilum TaxID=150060 RepID=UPI000485C75C|nr:metallophosphoesterase [Halonatronum saccharophilum]
MKLLVMTDTHIRGTTPSRRLDDFKETLLDKLKEVGEIAHNEGVDYILHGGDLFDRPDTAPSVVSDFIKVLKDYPVPIYIVAGNHDLYGHNPETLPRTMLGILVASGIVSPLSIEPIFLEEQGVSLQLTGRDFDYDIDAKGSDAYNVSKDESVDYAIHLVHGMLLDKPFFENGYTLIEDVKTEADITIAGHYHLGFGVKTFNRKYFLNPGALVRSSADIKEVKRKPKVAIINLGEEIEIKLMPLKRAKAGKEVLDREAIEEEKYREKKLIDFVREVKASDDFKVLSMQEILNKVANNKDLAEEVTKEALARLAQAQEKLGKGGE